jgi:hypothetical protein
LKIAAGLWIALGVFFGAYFGARMAGAVSEINMKRLYALFLLVVAAYLLLGPEPASKSKLEAAPSALETLPGGPNARAAP